MGLENQPTFLFLVHNIQTMRAQVHAAWETLTRTTKATFRNQKIVCVCVSVRVCVHVCFCVCVYVNKDVDKVGRKGAVEKNCDNMFY